MSVRPRLTVVVPVYDNVRGARRTLGALTDQLSGRDDVEIVVVDDGSAAPVAEGIDDLVSSSGIVTIVRTDNRGPSAARNVGARTGRGEMVTFLDANDEPLPDWVDTWTTRWAAEDGVVHCDPVLGDGAMATEYGHLLPGCFAVARRVFDAVGGYDEALRFAENTDFVERATAWSRAVGRPVVHVRETRLAVLDISDPRKYDGHRADAMIHLLRRDRGRLDRETTERYARVGAVAAARAGRAADARRLALTAIGANPLRLRNWGRLVMVLLPGARRRRWTTT